MKTYVVIIVVEMWIYFLFVPRFIYEMCVLRGDGMDSG